MPLAVKQTRAMQVVPPSLRGDGGIARPPALPGSADVYAATAVVVGYDGAFAGLTSYDIERIIRAGLLWKS